MADPRLLIMVPGYGWYGQEQALLGVAVVLRRKGIPSHFLIHAGWGEQIGRRLSEMGFEWTALPLGTIWSLRLSIRNPLTLIKNVLSVVRSSLEFYCLLRRNHFSHLLLGNATFAFYLLPVLWFSSLFVIYRHGDEMADHSFFHRMLNRVLVRHIDCHVCNCQYLRRFVLVRFPNVNPVVIYNIPWRMTGQNDINKQWETRGDDTSKRLLFIGQIAEHKGILLLLRAFRILAPRYPELEMDLVGDYTGIGRFRSEVYDTIAPEMNRVLQDFRGRVRHHKFIDDPGPYFSKAHIHVCPSIWQEPSPNVVFEAKWYGIPSIAFHVGGIPELIEHRKDGFICQEIRVEDLATGIEYFLQDEQRRVKTGEAARRSLDEKFGMARYQMQWMEVLGNWKEVR